VACRRPKKAFLILLMQVKPNMRGVVQVDDHQPQEMLL